MCILSQGNSFSGRILAKSCCPLSEEPTCALTSSMQRLFLLLFSMDETSPPSRAPCGRKQLDAVASVAGLPPGNCRESSQGLPAHRLSWGPVLQACAWAAWTLFRPLRSSDMVS